jgi:hypothetical protein
MAAAQVHETRVAHADGEQGAHESGRTSAARPAVKGSPSNDADRGAQACVVLRALVKELGRWVTGRELGAAWPRILRTPLPDDVKGRWTRVLERSVADGRVLTRRDGKQAVYAPRAMADRLAASPGSDLVRVETAIARVVARVGGAVPVEVIEAEIESDETLAMRTPTSVASRVIRLVEQGRIRRLHAPGSTAARWYYAPNDSTVGIAAETELAMDRRMRAIRAIWRLSAGRPFTTRAVARYASARDTFVIADDTSYGWTNALQHLARQGFLTRLDVAGTDWHVRWALTKEWEVLSAVEHAARMADPYGRDICDVLTTTPPTPNALRASGDRASQPGSGAQVAVRSAEMGLATLGRPSAPHLPGVRIDVGAVSRARDVAALVAMAQARWAVRSAEQADSTLQEHGAARPVTLEEVAEKRAAHPLLLPAKQSLLSALHEATRVRTGMQAAAVTDVGTVRNTSYFAVRVTDATRAFVAVQRALGDANLAWLERVLTELHSDRGYSDGGVIPVPPALIHARAAGLCAEAEDTAVRLAEALPTAPLTDDERDDAERTLRALWSVAADARAMVPHAASTMTPLTVGGAHRPPENIWLDIAVAEQQFRGLVEYAMENPRALWARIVNAVRVLRTAPGDAATPTSPSARARGRGRQVHNYLDRVGFGLWVARRIGGPLLAGMAAQALANIGESRRVEVVIGALHDEEQTPAHTGLCAALGFFDDEVARDALTGYLEQSVADARKGSTPVTAAASTSGRVATSAAAGQERAMGAHDEEEEPWDAPVWRVAPNKGVALPPTTSGNAVATAVLGLGRSPCGGLATTLRDRERAALEAVRDHSPIPYARDAARQVLRGWNTGWTREQWLAV